MDRLVVQQVKGLTLVTPVYEWSPESQLWRGGVDSKFYISEKSRFLKIGSYSYRVAKESVGVGKERGSHPLPTVDDKATGVAVGRSE